MTKAEAIEAGELAKAYGDLDALVVEMQNRAVGTAHDEPMAMIVGHSRGGDGADSLMRNEAWVPGWMIRSVIDTLQGVIRQRLAALGVDVEGG